MSDGMTRETVPSPVMRANVAIGASQGVENPPMTNTSLPAPSSTWRINKWTIPTA